MQVVEITDPGHYLKVDRGFLEVVSKGESIGKVVLDDIEAVIITVPGCSISTVLIDRLAQNNTPIVISGQNYLPTSILFPLLGKDAQMKTMLAQSKLRQPQRKRLWQQVVIAKINNQKQLLEDLGVEAAPLQRLSKKVKSGDKENCEAQAARYYWPKLMGKEFRRDRNQPDINMALNYCYAIVRASVARAVIAAGLHPTFSLHHKGPRNPLNLVDDLIEPFRPMADWLVNNLTLTDDLKPSDKAVLAGVLKLPVRVEGVVCPLSQAALRLCRSYARVLSKEQTNLELPSFTSRIEMLAS